MAKILIIDDDEALRLMFEQVFVEAGHEVSLAANGREALERLNALIPDIILLDIEMPVMTGPEFAVNLRRLAARRPELAIPYMVMTGRDYKGELANFGFKKDRCFINYIPKMTPIEEIARLVSSALQEKGK